MTRDQGGRFITFEGGDGCGKSTQLALTAAFLRQQGVCVQTTRQPGATPLGLELRRLLLEDGWQPVAEAELLMFLADRAQHVREMIQPALAAGEWVLCDRYSDSTMAYQLAARRLAAGDCDLTAMLRFAECGCQPDLTLWLNLPPEQALLRTRQRGEQNRLDSESMHFHQQVSAGFARLQQQFPERIRMIDAAGSEAEVQQRIQQALPCPLSSR